MKRTSAVWGYEEIIISEPEYAVKYLVIKRSGQSPIQYHIKKKKTLCWLNGQAVLGIYNEEGKLRKSIGLTEDTPGPHTIEVGTRYSFRGLTSAIILEVSTQDDPEDCVELTEATFHA